MSVRIPSFILLELLVVICECYGENSVSLKIQRILALTHNVMIFGARDLGRSLGLE
jgi:hypothetical protein